jgi:hypothetical protein
MRRAKVLGATLVVVSAIAGQPLQAQTVGADLALFSSYVWRGLSLTNKPVAQPDLYVTFPAGNASVTIGGWANIDLGKYDDLENDISESGGLSAVNFAEFDPWVEVAFPVGKATITAGATAYIYPNNLDNQSATFEPTIGLLTKDNNTVEVYGKLAIDAPLSPKINAYYDVDKVKGLYVEGSVSHTIPASENVGVTFGALAGFNAGQDADLDAAGNPQAEFFNFADNGFTHLDLSASVGLTAGIFSITPALHFVINGDDGTKFTSPSGDLKDVKLWGGATISWSKSYGEEEEEAPASGE